jgi:hypothetical protein
MVQSIKSSSNGMGQGVVHFIGTMARESTMEKRVHLKKKFEGFPMFFTFENFKKSLFGRHEAAVESALASSSSLSSSSSL